MKARILLLLAALIVPGQSFAESAVWKISSATSSLFLAGTLHILSKEDYPLPIEFETAYLNSSHVVFETDLDVMNSSDTASRMMEQLTYSDGSTLLDRLSAETTTQLREYSGEMGIPLDALQTFKPGLLLSMLTSLELKSFGMDAPGVEAHYSVRAKADNKTLGSLESIETQILLLAEIGDHNPDLFIKYMLSDMPQLQDTMSQLRKAWRGGDLLTIDRLMLESTQAHPNIYTSLLTDRNKNWLPQIKQMLGSDATEMVLVGAAHLGGEHGLLNILEASGYTVKRL